ncbi:MAG: nickel-dependent hydrogenase large subunit [Clostridia bacterium]|nr:nickel-dependent hydrogenase large subunit [Clostridia bacterium]
MSKRSIVPFGPQHPVLPEPIHLDLVLEDERVVEAIPSIGFVHRGLEKLVEKREYTEYVYVAERICGICSFQHGSGYCQAVEAIMNVEIPPRAEFLRTIWAELSRMHSHLLWLGLLADAFGFESLFYQCWRLRERVLDIFEMTTGGRVIFSVCKVGGVRRDISADDMKKIITVLEGVVSDLKDFERVFFDNYTVKSRLCGVGVLSKEKIFELGSVGPVARGSGIATDMRKLGYAAYDKIPEVEPIIETAGDCYARCLVRLREIYQSVEIIKAAASVMPEGEASIKIAATQVPNGEYFSRVEQPRGEAVYYVRGNGTKFLERFRVRTPTFANLGALLATLPGCDLADVPMLVLTIDPCISCTER